jgi:adenylate cyclase
MPDHAAAAVELACDMVPRPAQVGARHGLDLELRVGIASGPVMAGVIGRAKFSYDAWGETVNLAARLQTAGQPGRVHISAATRSSSPNPAAARAPGHRAQGHRRRRTCFIDAE